MRIIIQRVTDAKVTVEGELLGEIGPGFLALVGFGSNDTLELAGSLIWKKLIDKLINLRVFLDDQDRMNLSLADISGDLMLISQFTLYADCKKAVARPSPEPARPTRPNRCSSASLKMPAPSHPAKSPRENSVP